MESDEQLGAQARTGDREAASRLLHRFYRPVYGYLRRLCGDDEEAKDLTQLTFAKAWTGIDGYNPNCSFKSWLYRIAHNVQVDWSRRLKPSASLTDEWWNAVPDPLSDPSTRASVSEDAARAYRLVDELNEKRRQTIHLHFYQGLSLKETARALKSSVPTVKYRIRKALAELRIRFASETGAGVSSAGPDCRAPRHDNEPNANPPQDHIPLSVLSNPGKHHGST